MSELTGPRLPAERVIVDRVANGFFLQVGCRGAVSFFIAKDAEEAADFVAAFDWRAPLVPPPAAGPVQAPGASPEGLSHDPAAPPVSGQDNGHVAPVPLTIERKAKK